MKVKITKTDGRIFEYFLYLVMILETALAVFVYKVSAPLGDFLNVRLYLSVIYFSFLGWCFYQLNRLYRKRKEMAAALDPRQPEAALPPEPMTMGSAAVADTPAEIDAPSGTAHAVEPARLVFGLTGSQFMVILVVFLTALVTFSWVLARMAPAVKR